MTSCKKDEEDTVTPVTDPPTITFPAGAEKTITGNPDSTEIAIRIQATEELKELELIKVVGTTETSIAKVTSFSSKTDVTIYPYINLVGETLPLTIKFKLTDKKSNSVSATFTIKKEVVITWGDINAFSAKLLGAQGNNNDGGFFASTTGTVYNYTNAKTNSSLIDLCYAYPTSAQPNYVTYYATLAAPSDAICTTVIQSDISTWATRNVTKIHTITLTDAEFTNMTNDELIQGKYEESTTTTLVNNLAVGNYLAFKTIAGKKGIIKIKALTISNTGSITIDVKVQK